MNERAEQTIWERISAKQHAVAVGFTPTRPPQSLRLIRVSCDVPRTTLGPIEDARRKVEIMLDLQSPLFEQARELMVSGLRRRFLGDVPAHSPEAALVDACNRLAKHEQPCALVFDAIDAADSATCTSLRRIVEREGWLKLPLLVVQRGESASPAVAQLVDVVRAACGNEAIIRTEPAGSTAAEFNWRVLPAEVIEVLRAGAVIGSGFEAELVAELLDLPHLDVLDCLQRAADGGAPIEDRGEERFFLPEPLLQSLRSSLLPSLKASWNRRLAELLSPVSPELESEELDEDEEEDFDDLDREGAPTREWHRAGAQPMARHTGSQAGSPERGLSPVAAVPEPGHGHASVTPIRGQGSIYGDVFDSGEGEDAGTSADDDVASLPMPDEPLRPASARAQAGSGEPGAQRPPSPPTPIHRASTVPPGRASTVPPAGRASTAPPHPQGRASTVPPHPQGRASTVPPHPQGRASTAPLAESSLSGEETSYRDIARAAQHLEAAGHTEEAAERYATAALQAATMGAYGQAMDHGRKALMLVEELPLSPSRRRFRARVLIELSRLQWQAADFEADGSPNPTFTLQSALATADIARKSLTPDDPLELAAELLTLTAGICYDLGDLRSLERAMEDLTTASRLLLDSGDSMSAARLLNDQAAVYVRLGDPVRAAHLLGESRRIFSNRSKHDPITIIELAETHHLLARLPLHARIRTGREADAYATAFEQAKVAEECYRRLGAMRELARVWETMGRIELARQRPDQAAERLSAALQVQTRMSDLTGLARTTAALSEVLAQSGKPQEALAVLGDSIVLNLEKGSPIGLAFNRRAFTALSEKMADTPDSETKTMLTEVAERLAAAEAVLGRVNLPESIA